MRHTPGPWDYDGIRIFAPAADEIVMVRDAAGTEHEHRCGLIALVYAPLRNAYSEREANARLITAAPTLLRTLKTLASLAEALDIGVRERLAIRHLIDEALEAAEDLEGQVP